MQSLTRASSRRCGARAAGFAALLFSLSPPAAAEVSRQQCIDADTQAQSLRRAGKLGRARESLHLCAGLGCPATVSNDCAERLDELERAQPTMVFGAKDASGTDLVDVRVLVDGAPLADRLTGVAVAVDPGEHSFEFVSPYWLPITKQFVVREGDKSRTERIVFQDPAPAPTLRATASDDSTAHTSPISVFTSSGHAGARALERPWASVQGRWGIVVGAAGVAGVVVGGLFGLSAASYWNRSQAECPRTTCTIPAYARAVSDTDQARDRAMLSTIGFAAGVVLVIGGVALIAAAHPRSEGAGLSVGPLRLAAPAAGTYVLEGTF